MTHQAARHHDQAAAERCINDCLECFRSCLETIGHCLEMGGRHAEREHIMLLMECADICRTTAASMIRNSPVHAQLAAVCAEICERCAESCESMADGDAKMLECAAICRRCAESCRTMAA
jgi:hypothetical protein